MKRNSIGLALFTAFLLAIQPLLAKELLKKFSTHFVYFCQVLIQLILIIIYGFFYRREIIYDMNKLTWNDTFLLVSIVFLCIFLANILFYHLVNEENPSVVTSLIYSAPIITLLIAVVLFEEEKFDFLKVLGIIFGVTGIILVTI